MGVSFGGFLSVFIIAGLVPFGNGSALDGILELSYNKKKERGGEMPFEIVRNDITRMQVDAIVNTANPRPVVGAGTDAGIHAKAGPGLLAARQKIGSLQVGEAAITPGFDLDADYVIHTVGPVWRGGQYGEEGLLRRCYRASLELAAQNNCKSIAFPLISTGTYGFPKDRALRVAIDAISSFLLEREMQVYLVVFHREAFRLSEQLFADVASYIDEHYVQETNRAEYGDERYGGRRELQLRRRTSPERSMRCEEAIFETMMPTISDACVPASKAQSLEDLMRETDAGFSETLLKLITASGQKPSEVYNRANVTKQHYSKIVNNPDYQPKKTTAVAFAIALRLNLEETRDLIGRAGYALSNSSKFDVIVRYFIERKIYDLFEINAVLFDFDQPTLGV